MQAVQVMRKICQESEASLDYYSLFKAIMKKTPVPYVPLGITRVICCAHCPQGTNATWAGAPLAFVLAFSIVARSSGHSLRSRQRLSCPLLVMQ